MAATGVYQRLSVPIPKLSLLFDCIDDGALMAVPEAVAAGDEGMHTLGIGRIWVEHNI